MVFAECPIPARANVDSEAMKSERNPCEGPHKRTAARSFIQREASGPSATQFMRYLWHGASGFQGLGVCPLSSRPRNSDVRSHVIKHMFVSRFCLENVQAAVHFFPNS